ncbi:MAG: type II secretion system protein GspM [Nevskiales bacterium]
MTLKERWQQMAPRERVLVSAAGAVVALMLAFLLIWQPLFSSTDKLRQEVAEQRALVQWLNAAEPEVQRLRGARSMRPASGGSLLALVDQTSTANGLKSFVSRIQPEGDKEVRVWLEQAPYDEVMRWLISLELDAGVRIIEFNVSRGPAPGLVAVRINLQRGA